MVCHHQYTEDISIELVFVLVQQIQHLLEVEAFSFEGFRKDENVGQIPGNSFRFVAVFYHTFNAAFFKVTHDLLILVCVGDDKDKLAEPVEEGFKGGIPFRKALRNELVNLFHPGLNLFFIG